MSIDLKIIQLKLTKVAYISAFIIYNYIWFDLRLMLLWEGGQLPFWVKGVVPRAPKCFAKKDPRNNLSRQVPIQLKDLMSAFFILGIGLGLATFAFLVEKIIYFRNRRTLVTVIL